MDQTPSPATPAGLVLLRRFWAQMGADDARLAAITAPLPEVPLPSRLATGALAWASVVAATAAAGIDELPDPRRIASAYRSDRLLTLDGNAPHVWAPGSGFWRTLDGWVRTHANYPHHSRALAGALGIGDPIDRDELSRVLARMRSEDAVDAVTAAGGLCVPVRTEDPTADAAWREQPLLDVRRVGDAPVARHSPAANSAPLHGIRVLDLTRVIAGPVCTRTLALLGADVLRLDPPHLPEPEWQHLDTGHGKRSALLDVRDARFAELLADADVLVLGYRPRALEHLGLDSATLAARHPGLIVARLSAWGDAEPDRRGFDSLVQAESGIAMVEGQSGTPGALPAQALDHSAGYFLAAAVQLLLERRRTSGGTWHVSTSLRRIASELLGMPRVGAPTAPVPETDPTHRRSFTVAGMGITTAAPAIPGTEFRTPRPWGKDAPRW
ncbi:MAG: CoA transferase [Actinomycetota bacterium]